MGKQKKLCWKCGGRHHPPTGKKCEAELYKMNDESISEGGAGSESEMDSHVIPSTSQTQPSSSVQGPQEKIQKQILEQLQKVNSRLDKVEDRMARDQQEGKGQPTTSSNKKLSKLSKKHFTVLSDSSQSSSDSSDEEHCIPTLNKIRKSEKIQRQVDKRIRELERHSEVAGTLGKIKSKRGGSVEVLVKHKVAWPHEAILGGATRSRLSYDQLTMSQWVQGFCKNMLEEKDHKIREKMIQYMGELMEDATDFSWQGAKAAHAVLLCEFERGGSNWEDTARIDRIRRAHAQKHSSGTKSWVRSDKSQKPWYCKQFQTGSCTHSKDHEVNGRLHKHLCSFCISQGRYLGHAEKDCIFSKKFNAKNE